jgi:TolB protein
MNADGTGIERLTEDTVGQAAPVYSPNGQQLAFKHAGEIGVMAEGGGEVTVLTGQPGLADQPDWAPDGAKIVYMQYDPDDEKEHLWIMNADGSNRTQFTPVGITSDPSWSPDGTQIVYTKWDADTFYGDIWRKNVSGSGGAQLTDTGSGDEWMPDWQTLP